MSAVIIVPYAHMLDCAIREVAARSELRARVLLVLPPDAVPRRAEWKCNLVIRVLPGTSCSDAGYTTINAAVAAAISGDTIMVGAGTYGENVVLNKQLTLLGAQAGVNACGRMVASESVVTPAIVAVPTLTLVTGSAGSIIDVPRPRPASRPARRDQDIARD